MTAIPWITNLLQSKGVDHKWLRHREAFTSQETAEYMHFSGRRVAKTVIVLADQRPVVLALPANRHVAIERVLVLLGVESVRMATEQEILEHFPDCEPGAVPPLPHWNGATLLMDQSMKVEGNILFQAGNHVDAVRLNFRDWFKLAHPRVAHFTKSDASDLPHENPTTMRSQGGVAERLCGDPKQLAVFLGDLMQVLHMQAKEIEHLSAHVEQHTRQLLVPSQIPLCVSELSELESRFNCPHDSRREVSEKTHDEALALAGQRVPLKDMDPLC
jgi:Ala-tRNA(Pro) deacylase